MSWVTPEYVETMEQPPLGIIAGGGRLPILQAQGMREAGRKVACVGLYGQYDAMLPELCDRFTQAGIIQLGKWIRLLKRWGCTEAVLVGKVQKQRMYAPFAAFRQLPDWTAARVWYRVLRHDRRTDAMLGAVADEMARQGIHLIDTTRYISDQLAHEGVMTRRQPSAGQWEDIRFALPIVERMGDLDIGQSVAVRDGDIIAVEAIEGTDAMIERAGQLCPSGKWVLVKLAKPKQDVRFDVPTVGVQTITKLKAAGATCLAVEAGRTILLDKVQLLAAAEHAGIAVVGVKTAEMRNA